MDRREATERLPSLFRSVNCLKSDLNFLKNSTIMSINSLRIVGSDLVLDYTDKDGNQNTKLDISSLQEQLEIKNIVTNFSSLSNIVSPEVNEFAFVENPQGVKWLPGSLGGTYYGAGLYLWNGTEWLKDDVDIYQQLDILVTNLALERQERTLQDTALDNRMINLENEEHILFETLPELI